MIIQTKCAGEVALSDDGSVSFFIKLASDDERLATLFKDKDIDDSSIVGVSCVETQSGTTVVLSGKIKAGQVASKPTCKNLTVIAECRNCGESVVITNLCDVKTKKEIIQNGKAYYNEKLSRWEGKYPLLLESCCNCRKD